MGLIADIGPAPVAVDTPIFIYLIEEHPHFLPLVLPLFEEVDRGERLIVTSALTLLEVLVAPYRRRNRGLAERYEAILCNSRGVALLAVTRQQLRTAARLRATTALKTPDALQLSAALTGGCKTFLTNDRQLPRIAGLRILQLRDYLN